MGTSHCAVQLSGPRSSIISEKSSSSTTAMGKGNNEGGFSQEQLDMYKECFKLMDVNKDGSIDKSDLRAAFDNVGKLMDESELDSMLSEVGGGCTFDNMVKMFQEKMLAVPTIPMILLSVPSKPTSSRVARSKPRCSVTLS